MTKVPLELSDYIIDFLHQDASTLSACSLVCRAWTPAARYHLFRTVLLQNEAYTASFHRLLATSPELGSYVRDLTVAKLTSPTDIFRLIKPSVPTDAIPRPGVFAHVTHIRSLTLAHTDFKCVPDLKAFHHPTLSELSLSYCQFADFADVVDLANAFPHLASLSLAGLTWTHEERAPAVRPLPELAHLALGRECDSGALYEWLAAAGVHTSLARLAVRCASEADTDLVGPFLKLAGPALRALALDWSFTGDKSITLPESVSLASCTALARLSLEFPVHYSTALPWVGALLSTLDDAAAPALRTLALDVRLLGHVDGLDWAALNAALAAPPCAALEEVRVGVSLWPGVHRDLAEVEGVVRERLAPFAKKGAVRFAKI
ncbi:hypothetical protein BD413DRAFT_609176 [Trametes elegans]|nr:hypothetical protein BD413DRAFT_609176 [Trametes elegans]